MADKKTKKFNQAAHNARMKELEKTQGLESVNPEMYMIPGGAAAKIIKNSPKEKLLHSKMPHPLLRLKPYLRPYLAPILFVMLLAIPMAAIKGAVAKGAQYLTDDILVNKNKEALLWMPFLIIGLLFLYFILTIRLTKSIKSNKIMLY